MSVTICDLGLGNLRSVTRAFEACGARVTVTNDPRAVKDAGAIVVPGQGAFRDAALALDRGFRDALTTHIHAGKPYLGICLGLQLLFASSEESPVETGARGLAIFEGAVTKIRGADLKVPHMGWNEARASTTNGSPLFAAIDRQYMYFAHSFSAEPKDERVIAATTDYGGTRVCAVARDNVIACQFHPEKSQRAGLAFLAAFSAFAESGKG